MIATPPPRAALTSVEAALALLLDGLKPVAPVDEPLTAALGGIAAGTEPLTASLPASDEATIDGFAFRAQDLAGASAYSPVALAATPAWVEAGEAMPAGCDCVVEAALVDAAGPFVQVLGEAVPGQGVRRAGEDLPAGTAPVAAGRRVSVLDLLIARRAGLDRLAVRRPRLRVVNVGATEDAPTTNLVIEAVSAAGAHLVGVETVARDAGAIGAALDKRDCDLTVVVGGTGAGRADNTAEALAARGALLAHGIALQPGRMAAIGRLGDIPVIALPGAADQALGPYLALARPVLDHLSGQEARPATVRPLARKISSGIGLTELVLLKREEERWMPLATGALSLIHLGMADAWLAVPAGSEGYAAGTPAAGFSLLDKSRTGMR